MRRLATGGSISAQLIACVVGVSCLLAAPAVADTAPGGDTAVSPAPVAETVPSPEAAAATVTTTPTEAAASTEAVPPPTDAEVATVVARQATGSRLAVGDSLMVGASPLMRQHGFAIHAKVGRQFSTAPGIVRSYGRTLPLNVVIELGTNGTVSLATCKAVVRAAGSQRRVFLVNNRVPRAWQDSNNATLAACDQSFAARRVHVVDWYAASASNAGWFAADGIHTSAAGRTAFAKLIDRAVDRYGR